MSFKFLQEGGDFIEKNMEPQFTLPATYVIKVCLKNLSPRL